MVRPVQPGMRLTAARIESWLPHVVFQPEDISVTSSTDLVDSDLVVPLEAGGRYLVELRVAYGSEGGASGGRFKSAWSVPSGAGLGRYVLGAHNSETPDNAPVVMRRRAAATQQGIGGGLTFATYHEDVEVTAGVAGPATFQFSQLTSSATATILRADSYVKWQRFA